MKHDNTNLRVALYNALRDLGDLKDSDVPPAFIEKFVAASDGRFNSREAASAAVTLASLANANSFQGFEGQTSSSEQIGEYANVMLAVIETAESQSATSSMNPAGGKPPIGLAALQYTWG